MMIKDSEMKKGLPKTTESLCPECKKVIEAKLYEEKGKVVMKKTCKEHGTFKDVIWSDAKYYLWAEQFAVDGIGIENPKISKKKPVCPDDCGLCNIHKSHTVLANLDLTNRCNLTCPVCFANANNSGYVYEPDFETVVKMMQELRKEKPIPCHAIQFAGGEPTIYPHFIEAIKKAHELGFSQVQVATNGIRFAEDAKFVQKCHDAGLNTAYLQFDGFDDNQYRKVRGYPMLAIKKLAIENMRKTKNGHMSVCLVPTIVNNINDDQVGAIVDFAIKNVDIVHAVNFQPVAFSGRINKKELEENRFTIPDLLDRIIDAYPILTKKDFYPVPSMTSLSEIIGVLNEEPKITFSSHPHCGVGTFVFVGPKGEMVPITHFVRIGDLLKDMGDLAKRTEIKQKAGSLSYKIMKSAGKTSLGKRVAVNKLKSYIIKDKVPDFVDIEGLLAPLLEKGNKDALAKFTWNALMIGGMHFQDAYNYDVQRVMRCVIHYVTPDMRIIPFCAYNSGPTFRTEIESTFSVPAEQWKKEHDGRPVVEPSEMLKKLKEKMRDERVGKTCGAPLSP
jgi:uncharacterized radical SAM superfamily Fe-S cluster-containing enzyme